MFISNELNKALNALGLDKDMIMCHANDKDVILFKNGYKLFDMGHEWAYYRSSTEEPTYIKK